MSDEVSRRLTELSDHMAEANAPELESVQQAVDAYSAGEEDHGLGERLHDWVLRFESSHPELSRIMARVLDAMPGV